MNYEAQYRDENFLHVTCSLPPKKEKKKFF